MFTGFDLQFTNNSLSEHYYDVGMKMFNRERKRMKHKLDQYLIGNKIIDATKLRDDWFPQITADVFLSHSHKDEKMAIKLAGYLKHHFSLDVFIDSCVWDYVNDLQRQVDDTHVTKSPNGRGGHTYNYSERNNSTTHVHMMLASALKAMLDNTECVFFLNSTQSMTSINSRDVIRKGTMSPWIYFELDTIDTIRKRYPKEHRLQKSLNAQKFAEDSKQPQPLLAFYEVQTQLVPLNEDLLDEWKNMRRYHKSSDALDGLYQLMNIETEPKMPLYG